MLTQTSADNKNIQTGEIIIVTFNFDRTYTKGEARHILSISVNELNKWLGFMDSVKPQSKKVKPGKGRPAHMMSFDDLCYVAIFKHLIISGFDRKTAAEMVSAIDQTVVNSLIQYAIDGKIIERCEAIEILLSFIALIKNEPDEIGKPIKNKIEEKIDTLQPNGAVYLGFLFSQSIFGRKIVGCLPVVEPEGPERWSKKFYHFDSIRKSFREVETIHLINVGRIVSNLRVWVRKLLDESAYYELLDDIVGDEILDKLLSSSGGDK